MEGISGILKEKSVEGQVTGHSSMFSIYLGENDPTEFRDADGHNEDLYEDICFRMIKKGVMPCPDALEPWFVCAAHTDEDVATSLHVFEEAPDRGVGVRMSRNPVCIDTCSTGLSAHTMLCGPRLGREPRQAGLVAQRVVAQRIVVTT